jgi:hypothetical protein
MAFWLSVHFESVELTNRILSYELYLRQLVALALNSKPEKPKNFKKPKVKRAATK